MVVSDQFHFELPLSLGNKSPFSILHGKWNMTILEGEEGTSSDCAKSVMVKSPESLYALLKF